MPIDRKVSPFTGGNAKFGERLNEVARPVNQLLRNAGRLPLPVREPVPQLAHQVTVTATLELGKYSGRLLHPKTSTIDPDTPLTVDDIGVEIEDVVLICGADVAAGTNTITPGEDTVVWAHFLPRGSKNGKRVMGVLGAGGAGIFPVRLTQTGGSAGNKTTQCSFTYTVKALDNTTVLSTGVSMVGNGQRIVNAAMTAGTYGMAYYHTDGTLKLIWSDERITQKNCT